MNRRVPRFARFDHGVQDSQQLPHASYEDDLFWFACSNQAVIKDLIPIPTHKRAMKSRLFPPGRVALVVNRLAIHSSCALPDEKIHRFHLVRYGLGLVLITGL
jgi:hypothetical protein